jgi:hypothetical protein
MKRSDAVIEIAKVIEIFQGTAPNYQALEVMKVIDTFMYPPAKYKEDKISFAQLLKWEPEDEEK